MLKAQRPSKNKEKLLQNVIEAKGAAKRLNAEVDPQLYKRIKSRALQEDRSVSDITRQLWLEYLGKVEQPRN
jgi:hypothetical protein